MRLIHLTDPHLSSLDEASFSGLRGKRRSGYLSWRRNRRHVHRLEVLERLTDAVAEQSPDQVLLTGDLVHIGLASEIIEAAGWLKRLGPPEKVLLVPGNHDNYAADSLTFMCRHWSAYLPPGFGADGDYAAGFPVVREHECIRMTGVNSACVTRIFSAAGEIGNAQRERLAGAMNIADQHPRFECLLIHHPPFPGMTMRRKALRDAQALLEIARLRPPDLVLYGHIHCNREEQHEGIRSFCTASASSTRDASFRVIDVEEDENGWFCQVRLMTLESAGPVCVFRQAGISSWHSPVF